MLNRYQRRRVVLIGVAVLGCALTCVLILGGFSGTSDVGRYVPLRRTSQSWFSGVPGKTKTEDEPFLIPNDNELRKLNKVQLTQIYWRYINTLQTLCRNQARIGNLGDGGKEICVDSDYRPRRPCLVYSFGSNYEFAFELGIIRSFDCEVHTFDPSMQPRDPPKAIPENITFHDIGLDGWNHVTNKNWTMRTFDTIIKDLGHVNRTVDILKIDIEASEWPSFLQMFKTGSLQRVKQLAVEFHFFIRPYHFFPEKDSLKVLRGIYDAGFRIFMRDRNFVVTGKLESEFNTQYTQLTELSFVRVKS